MIRLSAIGDVINTLPSVTLLRRAEPDACIGFVVEDRAAELVQNHPHIDRVFVFPRRRWREMLRHPTPGSWLRLRREVTDYAREIRAQHFTVALDFQGNLKGALHSIASGAPRRIGFARGFDKELNHWFSTERVRPPAGPLHRVEKFASLLQPLGVGAGRLEYVLPQAPGARERVGEMLRSSGLARQRLVVVHPGTSERGGGKRWPTERFAELATRIVEELGADVVVSFGPGERALAEAVRAGSGSRAAVLPPMSLLELAELLRRAAAFVSADTGPMHLAAACGTPCVALFGPKDPAIYRPYGDLHTVVHHAEAPSFEAMQRITVAEVFRPVESLLAAHEGGGAREQSLDSRRSV
jgi:lipopolysaccharide heptosyltransferase I